MKAVLLAFYVNLCAVILSNVNWLQVHLCVMLMISSLPGAGNSVVFLILETVFEILKFWQHFPLIMYLN